MKTLLSSKSLLVLSVLVFVKGESNVTLTTATVCVGECIKPTTLNSSVDRRMSGDSSEEDELPNFRSKHKKRTSRSEIWKWDYLCQLQRKVGTCSNETLRFHYDAVLDKCLPFTFSGCNGNKNNFNTLEECETHCIGALYMEIKDIGQKKECALQTNSGLCVAMYKKFYYDVNANGCKSFIYGGCGGNANRFSTMYKCTRHCGQRVKERKRD